MKIYTAPDNKLNSFTCPHCNTVAQIHYTPISWDYDKFHSQMIAGWGNMVLGVCQNCNKPIIWLNDIYSYPEIIPSEPNPDMPESVKMLYEEAALISNKSPRAACALLRLAIERLCNELGETGKINDMIGNLVKKGLRSDVQKALDAVRVIGNNAVHPGQIAFDVDDKTTAEMLMKLLNIITERMITEPKEIDNIFEALPDTVKQSIEKRDK